MYKILEKQVLSDVTKLMVVEAPHVARNAKAGQFVIVIAGRAGRADPADHRGPRSHGGHRHTDLPGGRQIDAPDGDDERRVTAFSPSPARWAIPPRSSRTARWCAWQAASGITPMYPIAGDLQGGRQRGHRRSSAPATRELLFWDRQDDGRSDELIVCTDDGSYGRKALVTEPLKELLIARPGEWSRCGPSGRRS